MNEYRFDLSNFTIDDSYRVACAAALGDAYAILMVANRFIPINLFLLPYAEIPVILQCFLEEIAAFAAPAAPADHIDQLIRKALEDTR